MKTVHNLSQELKCPACGVGACYGSVELPTGKREYHCSGLREEGCRKSFKFHEDERWKFFVNVETTITIYESKEEFADKEQSKS